MNRSILDVKARIIACGDIEYDNTATEKIMADSTNNDYISTENHHYENFMFIKLNNLSRVRVILRSHSKLKLCYCVEYGYFISENNEIVVKNVELERPLVHRPKQLFLGLYETCKQGCLFCPLNKSGHIIKYSIQEMEDDIERYRGMYEGISITSAIPLGKTSHEVHDELFRTVETIRRIDTFGVPIGVSTDYSTISEMRTFRDVGVTEFRCNIEFNNDSILRKLAPKKNRNLIVECLRNAVDIFGVRNVSSNLLFGLGESDSDIEGGIRMLTEIGVIPTVYPFDKISERQMYELCKFVGNPIVRVPEERIKKIALLHKDYMNKYQLLDNNLMTMCPKCAAGHIMPGIDL